eukprot:CAMPEP_0180627564 /NCGR_PEP_ID=MMETSP1037_2-20121125/38438_1 /TAXON_ID=632150 /ORGANISM="Azadinium spinosum, Strain 3D9" /LENGTH=153 /DNA_ID=CAMNT_0022648193 /DNA_START=63 /DNA_END=521 /DNA_ORIENTATION=-
MTPSSRALANIRLLRCILAASLHGHRHKGEGHEALLATSHPTNTVILDLTREEIVLELRDGAPVSMEVVDATPADPEHGRFFELALALAIGPGRFLHTDNVGDIVPEPHCPCFAARQAVEAHKHLRHSAQLLILEALLLARGCGATAGEAAAG